MQMSSQQIYVSIELGEETHKVGKLWFHQRGARHSNSATPEPAVNKAFKALKNIFFAKSLS